MSVATDSWTVVDTDDASNDAASVSTGIIVDNFEDDLVSVWSEINIGSDKQTNTIPSVPQVTSVPQVALQRTAPDGNTRVPNNENPFVQYMDDNHSIHPSGKKLLNHSLIKRDPVIAASFDFPYRHDEYIEVVRRAANKEAGFVSKTSMDDLLPELLDLPRYPWYSSATLGRDKRWQDVIDLLDCLEREGRAVRLPVLNKARDKPRHCPFTEPPHETIRYSVQANGTHMYKRTTESAGNSHFTHLHRSLEKAIHRWHNGKWKVWYELSSEPPPDIQRLGIPPLRGSLRAPPGTAALQGGARRAFAPGVTSTCGAASARSTVPSAQQAVAKDAIDLVFGRPVAVSHASIAGKIHDTKVESLRRTKGDSYGPRYNKDDNVAPGRNKKLIKHCHVALGDTDAYCDRVEISARLAQNPRQWVILGAYDGCRDGHTEKAISLATCDAASRGGSVHCIALRFRGISWHNSPLLRVGAYGHDIADNGIDDQTKGVKAKKSRADIHECGFEDGVDYVLHLSATRRDDGDGVSALRRRYAFKGKSYKGRRGWRDDHISRAARRSEFRADIKECLPL